MVRRNWGWALGLALALLYPVIFGSPRDINLGVLVLLFAMLGTAWNVLGGYAGQISFGHAVFFGAGAYTSTILVQAGVSPWLGMLAGATLAATLALIVGLPTFRLAGHYFAIATIVVAEITEAIVRNADALGAARGLALPIRPSGLVDLQFHESRLPYYFLALGLYIVALIATWLLERHRIGYYLRAIREDETAARSVGISVFRHKLAASALSAALTALGGTFYAQYILFVDSDSVLALALSIRIALIPILGGVGRSYGPLLGATVLVPLQELTRFGFGGTGSGVDLVVYGALIVLISVLQPGGLAAVGDTVRRAWLRRPARAAA